MPIPFETLIPYGIITVVRTIFHGLKQRAFVDTVQMFGVSGCGLAVLKGIQNGGKKPRFGLDTWDKVRRPLLRSGRKASANSCSSKVWQPLRLLIYIDIDVSNHLAVMDRDRRLTGNLRGQTDNPIAPTGFELNNPWRVSAAADSQIAASFNDILMSLL